MAYTTINKSGDYFNTKLYTGNGGTQSITGVGFQPDFTWIKNRTTNFGHRLLDSVRGATKELFSNATSAENTNANSLTSFNSDGFSLGSHDGVNENSSNFASWNWKANGAGSANTDGTISSTVSASSTSGFSIVSYTGTGSNATVGHGLGSAPSMIFVKGRNTGSTNWLTGGTNISSNWGSSLHLNTTGSLDTYAYWGASAPNATTIGLSTDGALNQSGINFIAYCFAEKKGYSKFGSYTGNGNTDGAFIYTGFKPAFYIIKRTSDSFSWIIKDTKRPGYNVNGTYLVADTNIVESTGSGNLATDEYSNGFKIRGTSDALNGAGQPYIYMAFGQSIVGSNNIPATAR